MTKLLLILLPTICLIGIRSATVKRPGVPQAPWTNMSIYMPARVPQQNDEYICTSAPISPGYILSFYPTAHADRIHHMILYGCVDPFSTNKTWACVGTVCGPNAPPKILYAWARNAPPFHLPPNVGFPVGLPGGDVNHIVLQVHYAQPFAGSVWDYAGVKMTVTPDRPDNLASIYLLVGSETIPPNTPTTFDNISCVYNGSTDLHAFAFRTHSHGLGQVISSFRNRKGKWAMIGKRNPQWPQIFEKLPKEMRIKKGDLITGQCRFNSSGLNQETMIGPNGGDEMCNFYMMYYYPSKLPDPFPYGYRFCREHGSKDLFSTYPPIGSTLLPSNPELEQAAHQSNIRFGNDIILRHKRKLGDMDYGGGDFGDFNDDYSTNQQNYNRQPVRTYSRKKPGPPIRYDDRQRPVWQDYQQEESTIRPISTTKPSPPCSDCVVEKGSWNNIGGVSLGQISGIAMCPVHKEHLFIFHRGPRSWDAKTFDNTHHLRDRSPIESDTVLKIDIDKGGMNLIKSWGKGRFHMPHGITVDLQTNVWLTDVGSHQVFKFSTTNDDVKEMLVVGEKFIPGSDRNHFCKPTGVAVASDGSFFVSDGYCNYRIVKFSADGTFVNSWGEMSRGPVIPGLGSFVLPHDIILDEKNSKLYIADRENGRVQILTTDGIGVDQIRPPDNYNTVYGIDYNTQTQMLFILPGRPSLGDAQKPIKAFAANTLTNQISYAWAPQKGAFDRPHAIRVTSDGRYVFVAEITKPGHLWKFEIKRERKEVKLGHGGQHNDKSAKTDAGSSAKSSQKSTKPTDNQDDAETTERTDITKIVLIAMAALALPILCIAMVCVSIRIKKQGGFRRANLNAPYYKGSKWWNSSSFKDRNGFQPLSTEDLDAADDVTTDESDQEDTLYPVRRGPNTDPMSA